MGCSEISISAAFKRLNTAADYAVCRTTRYQIFDIVRIHAQPVCNSRHNCIIKILFKNHISKVVIVPVFWKVSVSRVLKTK